MSTPITVLLAEDHIIMRQGISALLEADGHFSLVGGAKTGREAVDMALALRPDVIVMDIAMPVLNGLEATRQIIAANPAARILILSAHSDDAYIKRLSQAGVLGFLAKQTSVETLALAIREIAGGGVFYSPAIARRLRDFLDLGAPSTGRGRSRLSRRESEVLQLVAEGYPNKRIASTLTISIKTVEKHRQHLMDKLNLHDTAGLTRYAISAGVIESSVQSTIATEE
ncbi:MAG: response regulator transcription factor [Burkholderiales bacterium]|nr:response regulator transcription factor [Opitutaceae bacterium]